MPEQNVDNFTKDGSLTAAVIFYLTAILLFIKAFIDYVALNEGEDAIYDLVCGALALSLSIFSCRRRSIANDNEEKLPLLNDKPCLVSLENHGGIDENHHDIESGPNK